MHDGHVAGAHSRTGTVYLPLHEGRAPRWLYPRMVRLAGGIAKIVIEERGRRGLLERISDPLWFQALGCVLGFDWNSSGLTTVTSAAMRDALAKLEEGLLAAGGKGAAARTLEELRKGSEVLGLTDGDAEELERASRLTAKVDSAAVQDGYQLYHHMMFFSEDGDWAVVQQGMSAEAGLARRYHWFSGSVEDFVEEPHSGIIGWRSAGPVLNMVARESAGARRASVDAAGDMEALGAIRRIGSGSRSLDEFLGWEDRPSTRLPEVYAAGMDWEVDWGTLEKLYEARPRNYEELLLVRGVGAKAVRALALVSDLIYGERASWRDPVKFSFAHGGKDGIPFPVDRDLYDRTIAELEDIVRAVEGEGKEREEGRSRLRRLSGLL
ncbi:hypothetical protein NAS2_0555 [Conexivisphaera calida]|uniref:DUF763 domain-containing protein n=1 Tax=Conexivisphaera calida TaxID=1874277 RepID=A0A4P2VBN4_9ARCH|nr:hypothetical protein NAS2_0555 [Conexivisphaera calida]